MQPPATPERAIVQRLEPRRLCSAATAPHAAPRALPHYDHVLVVVEENHAYDQILGPAAFPPTAFPFYTWAEVLHVPMVPSHDPFIRSLARSAAVLTNAHALTHPSQPNYLALFSGSTEGVTSDATITTKFTAPSLGGQLIAAGNTFAGYSEGLPHPGYTGDDVNGYARRHNPWVNFTDVPAAGNLPFGRFPKHFADLPNLSFVIPKIQNDMHSGSIQDADQWLRDHVAPYVRWARKHNSLLILTWDEDNGTPANHIPTLFAGAHIQPGNYNEPVTDYRLLNTMESLFALPPLGAAANESPVTDVFQ